VQPIKKATARFRQIAAGLHKSNTRLLQLDADMDQILDALKEIQNEEDLK